MITQGIALVISMVLWIIESLGYAGVFVLMLLESANIPVPSEAIMPFAGFLTWQGTFSFWWVVVWGTAGNIVGSLVSYYGAEWIVARRDRLWIARALISDRSLAMAHRWFERWGGVSVFFARLVPVVRTFISFPAGIGKMRIVPFIVFTAVGSFAWSLLLAWMGYVLGARWDVLSSYFHIIDAGIVIILGVALAWWIAVRYKKLAHGRGDITR
ncbi:MAG: DedA family protein [Candidatus Paceibacterota bacterium]|jgi:membrane protein DedA with SNARE-associated domain